MVSPHQGHQSRPFTPPPPGDEQHELQTVVVEQLSVDYVAHELPSVDVHHSVQFCSRSDLIDSYQILRS